MVDFYIDKYPVTNQQYQEYLQATKYSPADNWNYLKDWDNHTFPQGWANKPVTWVSLNEARAYCGWAGKRLPHVYEWQYAAQGNTSNPYPWGTASDPTRVPQPDSGRSMRGPDDVDAHSPAGDSPFGVADLLGNVWQYTDEFQDDHTRTVVLKGGSYYRPSGSMWYFPQCTQLTQHNKYMLMDDAYERSGALGFRCAADATKDSPKPYVPTCNSTLCGRLDVRVPQSVDLTKEASQAADGEWAHWGTTTPLSVDRKKLANGAQHRISDASVLGGSAQQYNNNPNAYVWTDGEPDATGSTTTGIYVAGTGKGFKLTVPASATNTTLRVYVGVWNSHATFTATLDDGLSPAYTSSDLSSAAGTMNGVYEIQFRSSKPGATLTVTFTQTGEDNGEGNVTLQSASLFATPSPASDLSN